MRALTLTQPWCGLVASGIKLIENRSRHMIKREDFGKSFALHASCKIDQRVYSRIYELAPELLGRASIDEDLGAARFLLGPDKTAHWYRLSRITSAVIAIATIDSVLDPVAHGIGTAEPEAVAPLPMDQRRWFFGPIGYVLRDVRALATPIPCPGKQPFWHLPDDIEAQVTAQLARAA